MQSFYTYTYGFSGGRRFERREDRYEPRGFRRDFGGGQDDRSNRRVEIGLKGNSIQLFSVRKSSFLIDLDIQKDTIPGLTENILRNPNVSATMFVAVVTREKGGTQDERIGMTFHMVC